ncbi:MAG: PadR family transcriptional regulator [Candidatus Nanoarchaeia archaeon]|nr:PadR family transcriptional regulator [Candidatus Nanoarchaeia archaeon]
MKNQKIIDMNGLLSFLILHEISQNKLCGDELADLIGKRKGNKLTPGTIYPALKVLRENKLIILKQKGRKKIYSLTKKGKNELNLCYKTFGNLFKGLKSKIK